MKIISLLRKGVLGGVFRHAAKCGAGQICGEDQNDANLRISRAYLPISDHCRVTVRVRAGVRIGVRVRVTDCCIQNAGESDRMRINHVTETDQWRAPPRSAFCRVRSLSSQSLGKKAVAVSSTSSE